MSLGSLRLDPVVADVVSFFNKEDSSEFVHSSSTAFAIAKYFRLISKRNSRSISISIKDNEINLIDTETQKIFVCGVGEIGKVVNRLSACKYIGIFDIHDLDVDEKLMKQLLKIKIPQLVLHNNRLVVSPNLFASYLRSALDWFSLSHVELSNNLITDENMKMVYEIDVYCSLHREKQHFSNRITKLTDEFLRFQWHQKLFNLSGFFTEFTVKGIVEYCKNADSEIDFGTIGCDQLDAAIAYKNSHDRGDIKLYSWNGQQTMVFNIFLAPEDRFFYYETQHIEGIMRFCFAVSLTENCNGYVLDVQVPQDVVSAQTLGFFFKSVEALNSDNSEDTIVSEQRDIRSVWISYRKDYKLSTRLKIGYKENAESIPANLIRTDVKEDEAFHLIAKFLKTCRSIEHVEWSGDEMQPGTANILKRLCSDISFRNIYDEWLTDEWLLSFVEGQNVPLKCSIKDCCSSFTANGIKFLLQVLESEKEKTKIFEYDLGTMWWSASEMKEMLQEFENVGLWKIERYERAHYYPGVILTRNLDGTDVIKVTFGYYCYAAG